MRGRRGMLELFRLWDGRGEAVPLADLLDGLERLDLGRDDLAGAVEFDEATYRRTSILRRPHYEALVLCWKSGQGSPIHDHSGSCCGVRVVEGRATETSYGPSPCGRLVPLRSTTISSGEVTGCRGAGTHQMANLEPPGLDLITLHVYSPPPSGWRYYALDQTTLADHDRLIRDRPATVFVDFGHVTPAAPLGMKSRRRLPWTT